MTDKAIQKEFFALTEEEKVDSMIQSLELRHQFLGLAQFAYQKNDRLHICNGTKLITHTKQHPIYYDKTDD